jgi:hypothetical protein
MGREKLFWIHMPNKLMESNKDKDLWVKVFIGVQDVT